MVARFQLDRVTNALGMDMSSCEVQAGGVIHSDCSVMSSFSQWAAIRPSLSVEVVFLKAQGDGARQIARRLDVT